MTTADTHAHDQHGHDDHGPLAHHFESMQQQFEAGKLGMWLFLATEVLLFGGLFCGYTIWRFQHPEMFRFGSTFLDTTMGAVNTAVLIASSFTMATAVTMAQLGKQRPLIICLVLTLLGAFGFLGIKFFEYKHKFEEGYFPGVAFYGAHEGGHTWDPVLPVVGDVITPIDPAATAPTLEELGLPADANLEAPTVGPPAVGASGINPAVLDSLERPYRGRLGKDAHVEEPVAGAADLDGEHAPMHDAGDHDGDHGHGAGHDLHPMQNPERPANAHMFFNIYFMMTGLHGIHVVIGGLVICWLIVKAARGQFGPDYFTPVDLGGLYWHVVDLIWIFLFPLFYLI